MRQQILPLLLCLFVSIFAHATPDLAVENMVFDSIKTAKNKAFDFKAKDLKPTDKKVENPVNKVTYLKAENTPIESAPSEALNSVIFEFEENSYISNTILPTENVSFSKNIQEAAIIPSTLQDSLFGEGMFYGFALMVILLNLICFFLFEEKLFLWYSLSLAAMTSLFFYSDGLLSMVGLESIGDSFVVESVLILIAVSLGTAFASRYLTLKEVMPKLSWVSLFALSTAALLILTAWLSDVGELATIANAVCYSVLSVYFLAGVYLFSKKNYPKFYVIAYSIPLLFAIDFFVLQNMGIGFLITEGVHLKAATLVEMLILTYAIVYRMRAVKEENKLRQTELRIFLKRQEVMTRKSASQLMEDMYLENLIMHYDLDGFEIKLLQYISEGKDNAKIARKLKTTEAEIEEFTVELYHKLEISEHIQEDYRMVDNQPDYIYN